MDFLRRRVDWRRRPHTLIPELHISILYAKVIVMKKFLFCFGILLVCVFLQVVGYAQVYPYNFNQDTVVTGTEFIPTQTKSGNTYINWKVPFPYAKMYFTPLVDTVAYVPTATGNLWADRGKFVTNLSSGNIWYIDKYANGHLLWDNELVEGMIPFSDTTYLVVTVSQLGDTTTVLRGLFDAKISYSDTTVLVPTVQQMEDSIHALPTLYSKSDTISQDSVREVVFKSTSGAWGKMVFSQDYQGNDGDAGSWSLHLVNADSSRVMFISADVDDEEMFLEMREDSTYHTQAYIQYGEARLKSVYEPGKVTEQTGLVSVLPGEVRAKVQIDNTGNSYRELYMNQDSTTYRDDKDGKGIQYYDDYSGNFTDRTLPDVYWVRAELGDTASLFVRYAKDTVQAVLSDLTVGTKSNYGTEGAFSSSEQINYRDAGTIDSRYAGYYAIQMPDATARNLLADRWSTPPGAALLNCYFDEPYRVGKFRVNPAPPTTGLVTNQYYDILYVVDPGVCGTGGGESYIIIDAPFTNTANYQPPLTYFYIQAQDFTPKDFRVYGDTRLQALNVAGTATFEGDVKVTLTSDFQDFTITDARTNTVGIQYAADYSSEFTDRSLVDRGLVKSMISDSLNAILDEIAAEVDTSGTAVFFKILPVDVTNVAADIAPPASASAGKWFAISDSRGNAATNNISIDFDAAGYKLHGKTGANAVWVMNADADFVRFTYINSTIGFIKSN